MRAFFRKVLAYLPVWQVESVDLRNINQWSGLIPAVMAQMPIVILDC